MQEDGAVITPETITTYIRDAAGRALSERKDTGAMATIGAVQYDLLGREISRTDILGRTTTTAYSTDGLSATVAPPRGQPSSPPAMRMARLPLWAVRDSGLWCMGTACRATCLAHGGAGG